MIQKSIRFVTLKFKEVIPWGRADDQELIIIQNKNKLNSFTQI